MAAMASLRRPRGRPPVPKAPAVGCVWVNGGYVDIASGEPHCAADTRERSVQRRRRYDRARYWDPMKNVRKQRLALSARKSGRPSKLIQLKLDELASTDPCVAEQCVHRADEETGPDVKLLH